jgi:hypothetical protein
MFHEYGRAIDRGSKVDIHCLAPARGISSGAQHPGSWFVTRYDSIRHLLKQTLDAIDGDGGLAATASDGGAIASFRDQVQSALDRLDPPNGQAVEADTLARDLFALLRACTGDLATLKPVLEDAMSVTKTISG